MKISYALRQHWPEYLMEAWGLGMFMIAAGVVTTILESHGSPVHQAIPDPLVRRILIGIAMGLTAIAITYSPWGKQSGAHINPSVTLTFFRLGKVSLWDAVFYVIFQFVGGLAGVIITAIALNNSFRNQPVQYIVTAPGSGGVFMACIAEFIISFGMMTVVLYASNNKNTARFTGLFAGFLVAMYVIFESPISGFSMNPARTIASALPAGIWTAIWIYFLAPILGMLSASESYLRFQGPRKVFCAKLHHQNDKRCIHCQYQMRRLSASTRAARS